MVKYKKLYSKVGSVLYIYIYIYMYICVCVCVCVCLVNNIRAEVNNRK